MFPASLDFEAVSLYLPIVYPLLLLFFFLSVLGFRSFRGDFCIYRLVVLATHSGYRKTQNYQKESI
ncbi:hypothetical protein M408DRAFT_236991 [Serendipita vermifera MAFF 305830]|uniref:Uncharacterized protein n=1 Tax=Serendipita vermifera MAFF 305830 TaxID=933852 RepID=A0A0C2X083_SERVB|nr:hypothetical protein M408DRAFT_236991 [Serendipita vermifera MAFF 305830]